MTDILNLYYYSYLTRAIDQQIIVEYPKQKIRCPVHLSLGQEGIASGISVALKKKDMVMSNHRSHAHYLSKGCSIKKFVYEIYGKKNGASGGKGGSMHLIDLSKNFFGSTPIVGSTLPIATGLAFSNKIKKKNDRIVVIYFGDGAFETGNFHECLNFASLHDLKILFVCENNFFSVYSDLNVRQNKQLKIFKTSKNYNIDSTRMMGYQPDMICNKTKEIRNNIIKNSRPFLLELLTYRTIEHCGTNHDDNLNYRDKNQINFWKKKCPIVYMRKKFNYLTKDFDFVEKKIDAKVLKVFSDVQKESYPDKSQLKSNIYA